MTRRVTGRDLDAHGWLAGERDGKKIEGEIKRTLRMIRLEGDSSDVDHPETFASDGGREGSEVLTPKRK